MGEVNFRHLAEAAHEAYPQGSLTTAVVALTPPDVLHEFAKDAIREEQAAKAASINAARAYELAGSRTSSAPGANPELSAAARASLDADETLQNCGAVAFLARSVIERRDALSRPLRYAAIALSMGALWGGSAGVALSQKTDEALASTDQEQKVTRINNSGWDSMALVGGGIISLLGIPIGIKISERPCRRAAQRLARRSLSAPVSVGPRPK
jgi:hypothetical protein